MRHRSLRFAIGARQTTRPVNGFAQGIDFFIGSAHALPFPDRSFDVVFGMAILHRLNLELAS